mmetsp:Transcript_12503/g.33149  ORF Transcript_12503/g.33149 Transcript_12503/m.33149 type:complete len:658 (+) Transcript_12503:137-2110(+)|eukprot:CAMPEP_0184732078 /NCGR_PEP_ID=MMETSP0314-20130426/53000_1 /TAXON_ID=38298 /ORGANISM="Rhodella maculata, Strain CCMP 736" /LENGTH=657 /DNA_ID=CAMNT_0027198577 /DNA_START=128 /DNA_END=2101 /DNA_ORIENTATION=-
MPQKLNKLFNKMKDVGKELKVAGEEQLKAKPSAAPKPAPAQPTAEAPTAPSEEKSADLSTTPAPPSAASQELKLNPVEVFALREETQRMALRGVMGAGVNQNSIAGKNVAALVAKAPNSAAHAAREATWFHDPFGYQQVEFCEAVPYEFDFGNGVVKELPLVRVHNTMGKGWKEGLLMNLAYTGELNISGKKYTVEVVQGAAPSFTDRLAYPGFFNDPAVNVLLYEEGSDAPLAAVGRLKVIDGIWYSFNSNASGEQLTVNRIDAMGEIVIDAGEFAKEKLAFTSGNFTSDKGWQLNLNRLEFRGGSATIPAGTYTFSELVVTNGGKPYKFLWPKNQEPQNGTFTVPEGGKGVFQVGKRAELKARNTAKMEVHHLFDLESFSFELIDLDLGARVIPPKGDIYTVTSYHNSAGDELPQKWFGKLCGWTGEYMNCGDNRVWDKGPMIVTQDPSPPKVLDTRTLVITAELSGLYGKMTENLEIQVQNETRRMHGKFYSFTEPLSDFPDFAAREPDVVVPEAHMSPIATEGPWKGLPETMTGTFAAVYTCMLWPSTMGKAVSHYTFTLCCQGAARLFIDDKLMAENISHGSLTTKESGTVLTLKGGSYSNVRIEYYHTGTGPAALTLPPMKFKTEPYYSGLLYLDPDQERFMGINASWVQE